MARTGVFAPWQRQGEPLAISKTGYDLLRDPLLNKGAGFSDEERTTFGLHGLLPAAVQSLADQARNEYRVIAAKGSPPERFLHLSELMSQNEHLFYRVLNEHLNDLMPVVYTPTVAWATRNFGRAYQTRRGVWLTPDHSGQMAEVLRTAVAERQIRLIVATDNESILGIGDQGAGGVAIAIGKLALYTAGAGIPPSATLPVSLDVGTNNQELLDDPAYTGYRQPRLRGADYDAFVDEFVEAVRVVCPGALIQWEDFRKDAAARILERYRGQIPSFNDDIQGTGAVALAAVLSANRISGMALGDHRIAVYGAGAAGLGIVRQLRNALRNAGFSDAEQMERVAALDSRGLLVTDQEIREDYKRELAWPPELAARFGIGSERDLETLVRLYKPTVLIGTSGQPGSFSETIVRTMAEHCSHPVILPFSNPTEYAEGLPEDILRWSDGTALVATGSPFPAVTYQDRTIRIGQGNNVFIFPGLGFGALLGQPSQITDTHVTAAAMALADHVSPEELAAGQLFPNVDRLREICREVAVAVVDCILEERGEQLPRERLRSEVESLMWRPEYPHYLVS